MKKIENRENFFEKKWLKKWPQKNPFARGDTRTPFFRADPKKSSRARRGRDFRAENFSARKSLSSRDRGKNPIFRKFHQNLARFSRHLFFKIEIFDSSSESSQQNTVLNLDENFSETRKKKKFSGFRGGKSMVFEEKMRHITVLFLRLKSRIHNKIPY